MTIIPKERPVHSNLSTSFLDLEKYVEHCKREYGAGCITITTPPDIKGVIFFDAAETFSGVVTAGLGDWEQVGREAVDFLLRTAREKVSRVALYKIDENLVHAWAKLHAKELLADEASATEGSLEEFIKKLSSQKLTGYIDIAIGSDEAIVIFQDGQVAGGSFSWGDASLESDQRNFDLLIRKSAQQGGFFKVFGTTASPEKLFDDSLSHHGEMVAKAASSVIATLEELLEIFERVVRADADVDEEFGMLLKDKFVEKANIYGFLDPFANEFQYVDQRITFTGRASEQELATGITECVRELADELGVLQILKQEIANWSTYLGKDIAEIGKRFL